MAEAQKDKKDDSKDAFERLTGTQKSPCSNPEPGCMMAIAIYVHGLGNRVSAVR